MKRFVVFFDEKEGTSPLVRLLDNFDQISIVHQVHDSGWEPFDRHNCGPMSLRDLGQCLELILNNEPLDIKRLNEIYVKTAKRDLEDIDKSQTVGFKMRFKPLGRTDRIIQRAALSNAFVGKFFDRYSHGSFKTLMIDILRRNGVIVFLAVRQDVLRWALSIYHGDGTGKRGHLQFKLATGEIHKDQIGKIQVKCEDLEKVILWCEQRHVRKRQLMKEFERAGIAVYPLRYEDFLRDKTEYFQRIFDILEIEVSTEEINSAMRRGAYFQKVHSDDISGFVENHEEVMERFNGRFVSWQ